MSWYQCVISDLPDQVWFTRPRLNYPTMFEIPDQNDSNSNINDEIMIILPMIMMIVIIIIIVIIKVVLIMKMVIIIIWSTFETNSLV